MDPKNRTIKNPPNTTLCEVCGGYPGFCTCDDSGVDTYEYDDRDDEGDE